MAGAALADALRDRFMALHTALICDSMDRLGIPLEVMSHDVRPMYDGAVVAGRAVPILQTAVYRPPAEPYKRLFERFARCSATTCWSSPRPASGRPACGAGC